MIALASPIVLLKSIARSASFAVRPLSGPRDHFAGQSVGLKAWNSANRRAERPEGRVAGNDRPEAGMLRESRRSSTRGARGLGTARPRGEARPLESGLNETFGRNGERSMKHSRNRTPKQVVRGDGPARLVTGNPGIGTVEARTFVAADGEAAPGASAGRFEQEPRSRRAVASFAERTGLRIQVNIT